MNTQNFSHNEMSTLRGSASPILLLSARLLHLARTLISAVAMAYARERNRAVLAELDDRILRDIGLTRAEVGPRPAPTHVSLW